MRKLLGILLATFMTAEVPLVLIGCSTSSNLNYIMNRPWKDKETYRDILVTPISDWNSASTNETNNSNIITNLQDTLITVDKHDNFEGALADYWDYNDKKDYWAFHIRNNAHWTKIENGKQVKERKIKGEDFFNAFRWVFNKNNQSLVKETWADAIKHGHELIEFIEKISNSKKDENGKVNELYDKKFDKENVEVDGTKSDLSKEIISSYWLDRAILAFNLTPDKPEEAKKVALDYQNNKTSELIKKSFAQGKIIDNGKSTESEKNTKVSEKFNNSDHSYVGFHLAKPTPYFDSVITYLGFAPMPDTAVSYINDGEGEIKQNINSGYYYGKPRGRIPGYHSLWYSGPYVVSDYFPGSKLNLKANENYYNKEELHIKNVHYSFINKGDSATRRFLFETGDLSNFSVNSNDISGWDKYVGSGSDSIKNPKFQGTNIVNNKSSNTRAIAFNYSTNGSSIYTDIKLDHEGNLVDTKRRTRTEEETIDLNAAVATKSLRVLFRFLANRSTFAKWHSKAHDQENPVSTQLRNNWTSQNVASYHSDSSTNNDSGIKNGSDYFDFLAKSYYDKDSKNLTQISSQPKVSDANSSANSNESYSLTNWLIEVVKNKSRNNTNLESRIKKWKERFGEISDPNSSKNEKISALSQGNDAFLENDLLALTAFLKDDQLDKDSLTKDPKNVEFKNEELAKKFVDLIGVYDEGFDKNIPYQKQESKLTKLYEKVELLKQQVKKDFETAKIKNDKPITIPFLLSPGNSSAYNIVIQDFLRTFNFLVRKRNSSGSIDSPFVIDVVIPINHVEYVKLWRQGAGALVIIDWNPDFADPTTFLNTLIYGGAYEPYIRTGKLFKIKEKTTKNNDKIELELSSKKEYKGKEIAFNDIKKIVEFTTNKIKEIDKTKTEQYERLTKLAEIENYLILSSAFIIPSHTNSPKIYPTVSYVDELTRPRLPIGSFLTRLVGVKLDDKIVDKKTFKIRYERFTNEKTQGYESLYPGLDGKKISGFKGNWRDTIKNKTNNQTTQK